MQNNYQRLFLVGSMGAGKTTIGHLLADHLELPFYDTDQEIEKRTGADISWIFDKEGEEGFRNREVSALHDLSEHSKFVIATGGGAVIREENRALLKQSGIVIYLSISVEKQLERTAQDNKRPLLQAPNKEALLKNLFKQRDPLYRQIADLVVTVDRDEPRKLIMQIIDGLKNQH